MKEITAYMATDGSLHTDPMDCLRHEFALDLKPMIDAFVSGELGSSEPAPHTQLLLRWEVFKYQHHENHYTQDEPDLHPEGKAEQSFHPWSLYSPRVLFGPC